MERMKSQVKTGFKRQFSLGKLTKRLSYSGRSYSESRINCEDSEHLLENCEPLDIKLSASEKTNKKMASTDIADVSSSKTTSNGTPPVFQDENTEDDNNSKYKVPSSIIVLNEDEKKQLEYVLLQISLRDVGLA